MTIKTTVAALAIAGLSMGSAAIAQNADVDVKPNVDVGGSQGLVVVTIEAEDVANQIAQNVAQDLDITGQDVLDIGSVQVPVGIAANVCDVDANVLAQQKKDEGGATCEATNTSTALAKAVQDSMNDSRS